jgi:hypothetical protein
MSRPWIPTDPRTIIARTLDVPGADKQAIISNTNDIADSLAEWLNTVAEDFSVSDDRLPGYAELAERFNKR